jgi:hypothetical protein
MDMTCPKCRSAMRSYERNGVTVDQCTECRGIFLDRGELERLIEAEASYNAVATPAPPPPSPRAPIYGSPAPAGEYRDSRGPRYDSDRPRYDAGRRFDSDGPRYDSDRGSYRSGDYSRRRKRSFLENLFD